ncbi:MAG TPA: hypothetical protein VEA78_10185, partial [Acidimicrobiales bacterium]|nr:hypothetical protein [Acidimicrobiales bacterium]
MGGFARGLSSAGTSLKTSAKDKLKQVQIAGNQARNQIVDKATTGIDQVKETVDKHTYSLGKDETISSKGGTVAGFDEAEGMAKKDAQEDADARFVELKDLLVRKDAKGGPRLREGTLDLFNKITPRLAGGGVLKSWGSKEVLPGITLAKALKSSFANLNTHSGAYLVDMLTHDGIPSPAMQILDAMGYVTVEQVDVKNGASVIAGICSRMTPDEAKATFATLKRRGVPVGEIPYEVKVVADVATDTANAKSGDARAVNRWARNWDGRLAEGVLAIHERNESHGMTKDGINAFSKKKKQRNIVEEVRTQVARMIASETELGLEGEARMRLETKHPRFERALKRCRYIDDQLRARLIASVSQRDDEGLTSPVTEEEPSEFETAQEKDERHQGKLREDGQNLASVGVARSMLGDGGFGDAMRKGGLVKFIASMTPDARMMLVASQLPKEKRPLYLNPSTKASELAKLFTEAWEGGLRQSVYDSLFTATKKGEIEKDKAKAKNEGEKSNIANLQKDLVRVRSMLQLGGDAGPNYMALVDLSQDLTGTKVSTTTYGTRIWEIA